MELKNEPHIFNGLQRDLSIAKHPTNILYDAKNIRITARDNNTFLSITNERGPLKASDTTISGTYLGHCVLNEFLIIFTVNGSTSYIYKVNMSTKAITLFYSGNLGFNSSYPIEAIASYENRDIQKVYWTDGKNQPRVVNIAETDTSKFNDKSFDFIQELSLNEQVNVSKIIGSGEFPPGVIQYAFTYFNKYGQESNIFYTTPLQYISYKDRAGSPEGKIANAFKISIANIDTKFEFLRIYSLLRTSVNSTPVCKRLQDLEISTTEISETGYQALFEMIGVITADTIAADQSLVKWSVDSGASFDSISGSLQQKYNSSTGPFPSATKNGLQSTWKSDMDNKSIAHAYVFRKSDYPNLILKVGSYYYTWGTSNDNAIIYLGLTESISLICSDNGGALPLEISKYDQNPYQVFTYIDDGTTGEDVDPTELLYKGGEEITAKTIEQKDGTLFLGNVVITRPTVQSIKDTLLSNNGVSKASPLATSNVTSRVVPRPFILASSSPFAYINTLSCPTSEHYQGIAGFKAGEYYRLGVQFQYKNGKWSEPCWIGDKQCAVYPTMDDDGSNTNFTTQGIGVIAVPEFRYTLKGVVSNLWNAGYRKVRALIAAPRAQDRTILCQGVACPTMYRKVDRYSDAKDSGSNGVWSGSAEGSLYAQSSWLFRTPVSYVVGSAAAGNGYSSDDNDGGGKVTMSNRLESQYDSEVNVNGAKGTAAYMSPYLRSTEVMGKFDDGHAFYIDTNFVTVHSPDIIFDDSFSNIDFKGCKLRHVGTSRLLTTYGDIDIQTSTPPIGSDAAGFIHKSVVTSGWAALISGLFYNDYLVDDYESNGLQYGAYNTSSPPIDWPIYMWHRNGSLNNDVSRNDRSAELLKKKISNYRLGGQTSYRSVYNTYEFTTSDIQLFNSDELSMIKVNGHAYRGNVESMITPTTPSKYYFIGNPWRGSVDTDFYSDCYYYLGFKDPSNTDSHAGVWRWSESDKGWKWDNGQANDIGDKVRGLCQWRDGISIKYKSTPHLVAQIGNSINYNNANGYLSVVEVVKDYDSSTMFGGTTDEALQANLWIPCGPSVRLNQSGSDVYVDFKWGDTYFQRFECLKTYAFTPEDKNQVVEIASFMCETRVNIDGRYDRNRGQASNLNMSPTNFNLLNPVYSQLDNFFNYRILDEDYYKINSFPNQITWTKEKQAGSEIDLWTNITLASTYDMDGSKGEVRSLNTWKDQIFCFQDKGISNILFNSRVQIPTSDGLPIEITNSYKVDGYRYLSDGTGCIKKGTIKVTPSGIYFIDSVTNNLYQLGNGLNDITTTHNMTTWFKDNGNSISKVLYDDVNHDVYILSSNTALCYSEILSQFTSFMDYSGIDLLESYTSNVFATKSNYLYQMFKGDYNIFFGAYQPWYITFVSNGSDAGTVGEDKIFSNLEYRMDIKGANYYLHKKSFDYIRVTNEYQDTGVVSLLNIKDKPSNLKKKFRVWGIQIPRDSVHKRDRIRNTWCKTTLGMYSLADIKSKITPYVSSEKNVGDTVTVDGKYKVLTADDIYDVKASAELHDIIMQYYF